MVSRSDLADLEHTLSISPAPQLLALGAKPVGTHGYCELNIKVKDNNGTEETQRHRFVIADSEPGTLILGIPWLEAVNPAINWQTKQWRYPLYRRHLGVCASAKQLKTARIAFAMHHTPVVDNTPDAVDAPEQRLPTRYEDFADICSEESAKTMPEHSEIDHKIELEDGASPPWGPIYPLSHAELEVLRNYLDDMLERGWIRPSTSPAGAPILFVPKKGGKLRLCVDYRALNRLTRKDRTPLPLIGEILDRLSESSVFTKLDLKDAYHRLRIREGDEWKTAFRTRYGHFEYTVMPFGLTNAPATFQAYINKALAGLVDICCIVYLDDILIYSKDEAMHEQHVRSVLERLRKWHLYINLGKCEFHTTEVGFLGFIVSPEGIRMEDERIKAVAQWPLPSSVRDIQSFLGFTGFYRRFIHKYSKVTAPLTNLPRGDQKRKFQLTPGAAAAFKLLQNLFTTAPLLRHYDPRLPTRLETDASPFAIGAILSQLYEGRWHPVAYRSRKLTQTEERYGTGDIELLAIIDALRNWRHYLQYLQEPVVILTDHLNLRYWETKRKLSARELRWLDDLYAFNISIHYRPGPLNPADAFSRRPDYVQARAKETTLRKLSDFVALKQLPREEGEETLEEVHQEGARISSLRRCLSTHQESEWRGSIERAASARQLGHEQRSVAGLIQGTGCRLFTLRRDVLGQTAEAAKEQRLRPMTEHIRELQQGDDFVQNEAWRTRRRRGSRADEPLWLQSDGILRFKGRVYVPKDATTRRELLETFHDHPVAGHLGVNKTVKLLGRSYYWDSLPQDVKDYVNTCPICQRTKARKHRPYGLLAPLPAPSQPWAEISMDFVTGLPFSTNPRNGKQCNAILVIVDRFTKYALYIPTVTQLTASSLADLLFAHVFEHFGLPDGIVSDRGSLFTSHFWSHLCYLLAVKRRLSTAYHPQTDGQTERQNQNLEHYLRSYTNLEQSDWAKRLRLAQFAYNNSEHSAIHTTPAYALFGFHPRTPGELPSHAAAKVPTALERAKSLQEAHAQYQQLLTSAAAGYAKWYNKKRTPHEFSVGDEVLVSAKNRRQQRPSTKLADKYLGPFRVTEIIGHHKLAYKLDLPKAYRMHNVFPISVLEHWRRRDDAEPTPRPGLEVLEGETYEVEAILDHRGPPNRREFLISWKGYSSEEDTWEPRQNIDEGPLIAEYERILSQENHGIRGVGEAASKPRRSARRK